MAKHYWYPCLLPCLSWNAYCFSYVYLDLCPSSPSSLCFLLKKMKKKTFEDLVLEFLVAFDNIVPIVRLKVIYMKEDFSGFSSVNDFACERIYLHK